MFLDITINAESSETLIKGCIQVLKHVRPDWNIDKVNLKFYHDGKTNKLIGVWNETFSNQVLVRVFGEGTNQFINREFEMKSLEALFQNGFGSEIYAKFINGFCYEFFSGEVLTESLVVHKKIYVKVAEHMAALHQQKMPGENETQGETKSEIFPYLRNYLSLIPNSKIADNDRLQKESITKCYLDEEISDLEKHFNSNLCDIVLCHNDLALANIIFNEEENTVRFIDYEYTFPNYQYFDIANHFCEFAGNDVIVDYTLYPTDDYIEEWLRYYLSTYTNKDVESFDKAFVQSKRKLVNKFSLLSHLFWGVWAILQSVISDIDFDYLAYGLARIREYRKKKSIYLDA